MSPHSAPLPPSSPQTQAGWSKHHFILINNTREPAAAADAPCAPCGGRLVGGQRPGTGTGRAPATRPEQGPPPGLGRRREGLGRPTALRGPL